jgi:hypothetical protein
MVANPNALYLQDVPKPAKEHRGNKVVQLTPVNGSGTANASQQDVANALAAMTQNLLEDLATMMKYLSQEEQYSANAAQLNVSAGQAQMAQANNEIKSYEASLHPSFWHKVLNVAMIILKYVVMPIMVVGSIALAALTGGATAALIAVLVVALCMIPINGQSAVGWAADGIAKGIGAIFHLNQNTVDLIQGVVGVVIAIVLAIATAGATAAAASGQVAAAVEEAGGEVVAKASGAAAEAGGALAEGGAGAVEGGGEAAANAATAVADNASTAAKTTENIATKGARYVANSKIISAVNTFAQVSGSDNCWYNLALGAQEVNNPNGNKQEQELIATYVSIGMNILTLLVSLGVSLSSIGQTMEDAGQFNKFAKWLNSSGLSKFFSNSKLLSTIFGPNGTTAITRSLDAIGTVGNAVGAGTNFYQGYENYMLKHYQSAIARLEGALAYVQATNNTLTNNTSAANDALKDAIQKYESLLGSNFNYFQGELIEAQKMLAAQA